MSDTEKTKSELIKELEEARKKSDEKFVKAFQNAPLLMTISNIEDGRYIEVNDVFVSITGYSREQAIGTRSVDLGFISNKDREKLRKAIVKDGYAKELELELKHSDGRKIICLYSGEIIEVDGEKRLLSIATNITDKKKAETSLKTSEKKFRSYVENSPYGVFIADKTGRYVEVNPKASEITGYTEDELLKLSIPDLLHPESKVFGQEHFNTLLEKGIAEGEGMFVTKSGKNRFWSVDAVKLSENRFLGFVYDITDKQRVVKDLKESEDKYRSLIGNINEAVALHRMIYDENGKPKDFVFLDCNPMYEELTQLKREDIIDKRGLEVIPTLEPKWIDLYGKVALTGNATTIIDHSEYLDKYWEVKAYSPKKGHFAVAFTDVTDRITTEKALKASEERLSLALDASNDGLWDWDLASGQTYFSPQYYKMLGYEPDEFPANYENWELRLHPDETKYVISTIYEHLQNGEPFSMEFRMQCKDGSYAWLLGKGKAVGWDETGQPTRMLGTHVDISKRKKAEELTRQERDKAQTYLDIAGVMFLALDADGMVSLANQRAAQVLETSVQEIEGKNWFDTYIPESQKTEVREVFKKLVNGALEPVRYFENEVVTSTGNIRTISWHNAYIKDDEGHVVSIISSGEDITDRKLAEEWLRRSEERYRIINDASHDFIYSYDTEGRFVSANKSLCEALGMTEEQILGKTHAELGFPKEQCDEWNRLHELVFETEQTVKSETSAIMPDGSYRYYEVDLNPLRNRGDLIIGISGSTRDITERVLAEKEKEKVEAQLRQAQKMESVGRLAGGVAHDFNNLLTGIKGNASLAIMDISPTDPLMDTLEEIDKAADSAASLTRQLLAFSRKQIINPQNIDLNELIDNMYKMLQRLIGEDIDLKKNTDLNLGGVKADPGQVEQIIVNLAVNARDAMPNGGKLLLETNNVFLDEEYCSQHTQINSGEYAMLAISDNGEGMDKDTLSKIFDPFFTTKSEGEGTGLGLATVYGIVKQHNGHITAYSEENSGTTFKVYFPRTKEKTKALDKKSVWTDLPRGNETVLIVEDEEMVRNIAIKIFKRQGYKVHYADSGDNAIALLEKSNLKLDLLMTDIVMPNMNGRELAEKISPKYPEMKVLYTSGYTENVIAHHGVLDEGINFIGKPYTPQALAEKVRELLEN